MGSIVARAGAVAGLALLASCGAPVPSTPVNSSAASESVDPKAAFRPIGNEIYAMTYNAAANRAAIELAIRQHCAGRSFCKVIGWTDPALAATAMPMTDRELAGVKVNYTLNRTSGMDEASWN